MTMLTAFAVLLHRYSRQTDICIGTGIANRRLKQTEDLIGMFVNNVVLRVILSGNPSFCKLLQTVKDVTLDAYNNQDAPFDKVVESVKPKRDPRYISLSFKLCSVSMIHLSRA